MAPWPTRHDNLQLQDIGDRDRRADQDLDEKGRTSIDIAAELEGPRDTSAAERPAASGLLNAGDEDEMELFGYRRSALKTALTWSAVAATALVLRVVFHWFPEWFLKCTHSQCPLDRADHVLVVEMFQKKHRRVYIRAVSTLSAKEALKGKNGAADDDPTAEDGVEPSSCTDAADAADRHDRRHCDEEMQEISAASARRPALNRPMADGSFHDVDTLRVFTCKKLRYVWSDEAQRFDKLKTWGPGLPLSTLHGLDAQQGLVGLTHRQQRQRRAVYGPNLINVPVKGVLELLVLEVLNPFYIFQVASIGIWCVIEYYYFAGAIAIMSAAGIVITIVQTRRNQTKLRSTVQGSDVVEVCRGDGTSELIETQRLVPGDVILVPPTGCTMYCDAVLLSGTCIVNESMLTGESVPVTKTPLAQRADLVYQSKEHGRHTLFCGTRVVQTRFYDDEKVMAVVISTGFMTAKGSLVSAIMYPPPVDFRFERDSYKFIAFLASLASVGFFYSLARKIIDGETGVQVIFASFDVITICVPPALPAAMTAGIILAQKRLALRNIFCISPRAINVSGSLNCICFDKTGTLTEDGLDLWGVVPVVDRGRCLPPIRNPSKVGQALAAVLPPPAGVAGVAAPPSSPSAARSEPPLLVMGMATCHSLTIIDGVLSGDPLDLKMFEATGWNLVEPSSEDTTKYDNLCPTVVTWKPEKVSKDGTTDSLPQVEVGIVRQFTFSSSLQRMSVLCKRLDQGQLHFFCKGSPEMIQSLSNPETVPSNFSQVLEEYTRQGYRVIALAHRTVEFRSILKLQKVQREELEHQLTFLGLVVLENRLKEDTTAVISQLLEADLRAIMVTGDNLLTAISVARDCEMIPAHDQVVIVGCEEPSTSTSSSKPQLTYTLAENSSLPALLVDSKDVADVADPLPTNVALDMVDESRCHLAMTGKSWAAVRDHYPELVQRCAVQGTVFARMSPDQKQQLVQTLQELGYVVGMCGDGANDCGALKAAHAGIALTDSEASVASPFTSRDCSIACVPELIRQGRCALVTSFGIFKYMAAYSLCQFISVMILYDIGTNLTDFQFLYIDFFLICGLSGLFGQTQPHPGPLHRRPPLTSLLSPLPVGSLLVQTLIIGVFQVAAVLLLVEPGWDWFEPFLNRTNGTSGLVTRQFACHENYAVFAVSMFQYIVLALAFAKGAPYRRPFFTNYGFVAVLAAAAAFSTASLLGPGAAVAGWLELELPPFDFRLIILALSVAEVVLILLAEEFVVDRGLVRFVESRFWQRWRPPKEKYLALLDELKAGRWPPEPVAKAAT